MSGPFGDSSDANRKPRGPRPFAGQVHPPGSGPLKSSRVRRPTLAPFPSLAVPEAPTALEAPVQPPALRPDASDSAIGDSALEAHAFEGTDPALTSEVPFHPAAPLPLTTPLEFEPRELTGADHSQPEPDTPAIDAFDYGDPHESSIDAFGGSDDIESSFDAYGESSTQELPFASFVNEDAASTDLGGTDAVSFAVPDPDAAAADPFAEAEPASHAETFGDHDAAEQTAEWSLPGQEDERPHSALHTEELLERDLEGREPSLDAGEDGIKSSVSGDEDDWFSQAGYDSPEVVADVPSDNIETVGEALRSMTVPGGDAGGAQEPPRVSLPVDWAVSPEGEADLQSYVADTQIREEASEVLEGVARRVRSGEIVLALEPGASTEAVLASVLASLLT